MIIDGSEELAHKVDRPAELPFKLIVCSNHQHLHIAADSKIDDGAVKWIVDVFPPSHCNDEAHSFVKLGPFIQSLWNRSPEMRHRINKMLRLLPIGCTRVFVKCMLISVSS